MKVWSMRGSQYFLSLIIAVRFRICSVIFLLGWIKTLLKSEIICCHPLEIGLNNSISLEWSAVSINNAFNDFHCYSMRMAPTAKGKHVAQKDSHKRQISP